MYEIAIFFLCFIIGMLILISFGLWEHNKKLRSSINNLQAYTNKLLDALEKEQVSNFHCQNLLSKSNSSFTIKQAE